MKDTLYPGVCQASRLLADGLDPWHVLGLPLEVVDARTIRKAKLKKSHKYHPDLGYKGPKADIAKVLECADRLTALSQSEQQKALKMRAVVLNTMPKDIEGLLGAVTVILAHNTPRGRHKKTLCPGTRAYRKAPTKASLKEAIDAITTCEAKLRMPFPIGHAFDTLGSQLLLRQIAGAPKAPPAQTNLFGAPLAPSRSEKPIRGFGNMSLHVGTLGQLIGARNIALRAKEDHMSINSVPRGLLERWSLPPLIGGARP